MLLITGSLIGALACIMVALEAPVPASALGVTAFWLIAHAA
jgi:hypothetical protein